jgi:glycerate 2-kinase
MIIPVTWPSSAIAKLRAQTMGFTSKGQAQLKIVVAPAGFKEGLGPSDVAACIALGLKETLPDATITCVPVADGGEGFTSLVVDAIGGSLHEATVTGPLGSRQSAQYGVLGKQFDETFVIETASAAGLRQVPPKFRNPLHSTTFGLGELIRIGLDRGPRRIIMGCGDTSTNDAGAGMAQALGVKLLDRFGKNIGTGGVELLKLSRICLDDRDRRLEQVSLELVCSPLSVLCGSNSTTIRYAPQKGATPDAVEILTAAIENFALVVARDIGINVCDLPGGGACGGIGASFHALLGGNLRTGLSAFAEFFDMDHAIEGADLIITGEGKIDWQTAAGNKAPWLVATIAKRHRVPVIAIVGSIGEGAETAVQAGIDGLFPIIEGPISLDEAMTQAPALLQRAGRRLGSLLAVGCKLGAAQSKALPLTTIT